MTSSVWIALITTFGVVLGVVGSIYAVRTTARQTERAAERDEAVAADKTAIEGLRELADQNRLDREEWRKERHSLLDRMAAMERRMSELEGERVADRARIEQLEDEKHWLSRYIHMLREFITSLGRTPPESDHPLALD